MFVASAVVVLLLTGILLSVTTSFLVRQLETAELEAAADRILPEFRQLLQNEQEVDRIEEFVRIAESLGRVSIRFLGPDGEIDPGRLQLMIEERMPPPVMRPPSEGTQSRGGVGSAGGYSRSNRPSTYAPRFEIDEILPGGFVEITNQDEIADRLSRITVGGYSIAALVTLAASAALGLAVSRGLTRPIELLTATVTRMEDGDLDARADVGSRDEIGTLASRFNAMADRLSGSLRETRAFLADASHELRTPIAAMGNFVELLQDSAQTDEQRELLEDAARQADRMARIVGDLLMLSRLDGGARPDDRRATQVTDLIRRAWSDASSAPEGSGAAAIIEFDLETDVEDLTALISEHQFRSALQNILQNSVLALTSARTPDPAVHATVRRGRTELVITIDDNGPGISPGDLEHVFARFYRSRTSRYEGSGLGLSIARAVIIAHGGTIGLFSPVPGSTVGSRVEIRVPRE